MNTNDSNIYKLAVFCHKEFKEAVLNRLADDVEACFEPLYCAIFKDNTVLCSKTPHVLNKPDVDQCLIIQGHGYRKKSYNYSWNLDFFLQFIDKDGCVHGGYNDGGIHEDVSLGNDFSLKYEHGFSVAYELLLSFSGNELYRYGSDSWEKVASKVLKLCSSLQNLSSLEEMKLAVELYENDEKMLQLNKEISDLGFAHQLLKKERDQLQETINEIRKLIKS